MTGSLILAGVIYNLNNHLYITSNSIATDRPRVLYATLELQLTYEA